MVSQHEYFTRDCNADKPKDAKPTGTIDAMNVLISSRIPHRVTRPGQRGDQLGIGDAERYVARPNVNGG
ncbi:MAG: hypothetical protein ACLPKB_08415 [Xanthobacteraceae bacterium]